MEVKCLVLDKRYDDWLVLNEQLKKNGIDNAVPFIAGRGEYDLPYSMIDKEELPPLFYNSTTYPTWRNRPNAYSAWKCHKKMIEDSAGNDLLLLEDDAVLCDDFDELLEKSLSYLSETKLGWDMLYLGWYSNGHLIDTKHENVKRMVGGAGFHGVVLRGFATELLSKCYPTAPFDEIAGRLQKDGVLRAYAVYPSIIVQKSGFSYVEGSNLEKPERYKR